MRLVDHITTTIDACLAGTLPLFTTANHATGVYARSETCWAKDLPLSCKAALDNRFTHGVGDTTWTGEASGTLISPIHLLVSGHNALDASHSVLFIREDDSTQEVGITAVRNHWGVNIPPSCDFAVCQLDEPVTGIPIANVLPDDYADYLPSTGLTYPMIFVDLENKALIKLVTSVNSANHYATFDEIPVGSKYLPYTEVTAYGDSGGPFILIINDTPVILSTATGFTVGSSLVYRKAAINADMAILGGGSLTEIDLSGFEKITKYWHRLSGYDGNANWDSKSNGTLYDNWWTDPVLRTETEASDALPADYDNVYLLGDIPPATGPADLTPSIFDTSGLTSTALVAAVTEHMTMDIDGTLTLGSYDWWSAVEHIWAGTATCAANIYAACTVASTASVGNMSNFYSHAVCEGATGISSVFYDDTMLAGYAGNGASFYDDSRVVRPIVPSANSQAEDAYFYDRTKVDGTESTETFPVVGPNTWFFDNASLTAGCTATQVSYFGDNALNYGIVEGSGSFSGNSYNMSTGHVGDGTTFYNTSGNLGHATGTSIFYGWNYTHRWEHGTYTGERALLYETWPTVEQVLKGVVYQWDTETYEGTMTITDDNPPASAVLVGVPVGTTVGTLTSLEGKIPALKRKWHPQFGR